MTPAKSRMRGHAASKPTVDQLLATREQLNRVSAAFLKTDLKTGITFARIARVADDDIRKNRNCRAARKAYDTVLRMIGRIGMNASEGRVIREELMRLRELLLALEEAV